MSDVQLHLMSMGRLVVTTEVVAAIGLLIALILVAAVGWVVASALSVPLGVALAFLTTDG
jgi:hypothetical protein